MSDALGLETSEPVDKYLRVRSEGTRQSKVLLNIPFDKRNDCLRPRGTCPSWFKFRLPKYVFCPQLGPHSLRPANYPQLHAAQQQ
jgi:hypothetical protein